MLRNLFAIIILAAPASLWATESYQTDLHNAFQVRKEGKLQEALVQFEALSKAYPNKPAVRYGLAGVQALLNNYHEALTNLKTALHDDRELKQAPYWGDFIKLMELPEWNKVEAMVSKNLPFKKRALAIQLWKMCITDQAYYWHIITAEKRLGNDSPVVLALWDFKHMLNAKNQREITRLIARRGWPKLSEVGHVASAAFLIIQHASHDLRKQYIPLLEKACQAGEADWSGYALMYDRIQVDDTGKQLYGSQLTQGSDGKHQFTPIEDVEHVNERRHSKGLGPIEDYAALWGLNWKDVLLQMKQ
jgi:Tetratricopeptide repeat